MAHLARGAADALVQRIRSRGVRKLIAAAGLGAYGLFVVVRALISPEHADPDLQWARRGLLPLSVDNVAAGASLGVAGYSPWMAPVLFGACTFIMSIAGHQVGPMAAHFVPRIRTDLLTGLAFVVWRSWWSWARTTPEATHARPRRRLDQDAGASSSGAGASGAGASGAGAGASRAGACGSRAARSVGP
jgi:hypothetical protein